MSTAADRLIAKTKAIPPFLILLDATIIEPVVVKPIIWNVDEARRVRYEDIKAERYDEAIDFLCANYFGFETLCRGVRLHEDEESLQEMCQLYRYLLAEDCSIAAIDLDTDAICAVAIAQVMHRDQYSWAFWRWLAPRRDDSGAELRVGFECEFLKYGKHLPKRMPHTDLTLHLFAVAIARERKGHLFKEQVLLQTYRVARSTGVQAVLWMATSYNDQERALRVGMRKLDHMNYSTYKKEDGTMAFGRLDAGEHYASLMGWQMPEGKLTGSLAEYLFPEYAERVEENADIIRC